MIDQNGLARLADFGLLTFVSDPTYPTNSSSVTNAGTTRWMSPELLHPEQFGLKWSRPTERSDCYALGMVILEVLSGEPPFARDRDFIVMRKIIEGDRPERPDGLWFTDGLWRTLEQCWLPQQNDRPTIEAVLERLDHVSNGWHPSSPIVNDVEIDSDGSDSTASQRRSLHFVPYPLLTTRKDGPEFVDSSEEHFRQFGTSHTKQKVLAPGGPLQQFMNTGPRNHTSRNSLYINYLANPPFPQYARNPRQMAFAERRPSSMGQTQPTTANNPEPLSPAGYNFQNLPSNYVEEPPTAPAIPSVLSSKSRKALSDVSGVSGSNKYSTPGQPVTHTPGSGNRNRRAPSATSSDDEVSSDMSSDSSLSTPPAAARRLLTPIYGPVSLPPATGRNAPASLPPQNPGTGRMNNMSLPPTQPPQHPRNPDGLPPTGTVNEPPVPTTAPTRGRGGRGGEKRR